MSLTIALPRTFNADRFGVIASTLCAIPCEVTPFLLILLPTFGKVWSHPAAHWGMALVVVPIAVAMLTTGYRRHRQKWVATIGVIGVAAVLIGVAIPYLEKSAENSDRVANTEVKTDPAESGVFIWNVGDELEEAESDVFVWTAADAASEAEGCMDAMLSLFSDGREWKQEAPYSARQHRHVTRRTGADNYSPWKSLLLSRLPYRETRALTS